METKQRETSCFCDYKIKSHPGKLLFEHLQNVQDLVLKKIDKTRFNFDISKDEIKKIIKIITISHDFGKSTKFFQEYIKGKEIKNKKTRHSYLSALFGFYLADKLNLQDKLSVFITIYCHHGQLPQIIENSFELDISPIEKKQIESIDFVEMQSIYKCFLQEDSVNLDFKGFVQQIKDNSSLIKQICKLIDSIPSQKNSLKDFFLTLFLFSLLIDSDKLDAAGLLENIGKITENIQKFNMPDMVDNYKKSTKLPNSNINDLREQIYQEIANQKINLNNKIYSINVPTGTGKTFASLNFALKLKDKLKNNGDKSFNPKIIYCLPFTSIIDQNYSEVEKILKANNEEITSDKLLKHHYLAEVDYKMSNDNEYESMEIGKSLLLTENWMSSIVVTTFVQFFHSLISNKNKSLKKFHNIANSIVILDEIQAIPYKYWKLVEETLKTFSEIFNTYFVLVTATQPLIFKEKDIVSLIQNRESYFKSDDLNRIELINSLDPPKSLNAFKEQLVQDIKENYPDKSFLIILNTIKSSQEVFEHLQKELKDENIELKYLSTTVLPFERQKIIEEIKDKDKKDKRFIIVSTQVVEAGVDIDLDIVYRDLAPLDCIFQSVGRCNRNGNSKEKGIVKVFCLTNENHNNKPFAEYVYGSVLLGATKEILKKKDKFEEKDFFELANDYYLKVNKSKSNKPSTDILTAMKTLNFEGIKEFQLIENTQSQDFFIELNSDATKIKNKVLNIINGNFEKPWEKKAELLSHKKEFYSYVISVRLNKNKNFDFSESRYQEFDGNPILIPKDEIEKFYKSTGIGLTFDESGKDFDSGIMVV